MRRIVSSDNTRAKIQEALKKKTSQSTVRPTLTPAQIEAMRTPPPKKVIHKQQHIRPQRPTPIPFIIEKFVNADGTFKHSGDIGDLIYSLPIIRYYGGGSIYLNPLGLSSKKIDGTHSGFTSHLINLLQPLLEQQPYIKDVGTWSPNTKVKVDIDAFRKNLHIKKNLCQTILDSFNTPFSETETPWVVCEPYPLAKVVFARSFRYRNALRSTTYKELLEEHKKDAVFIGLPEEYTDFMRNFGKIDFYKIRNFLEMAQIINGSELFVGNQSSPMALAIAMHKPFVQEAYSRGSDCIFERQNATYM